MEGLGEGVTGAGIPQAPSGPAPGPVTRGLPHSRLPALAR